MYVQWFECRVALRDAPPSVSAEGTLAGQENQSGRPRAARHSPAKSQGPLRFHRANFRRGALDQPELITRRVLSIRAMREENGTPKDLIDFRL